MTVTSGFYDSLNGDRKYNAAQFGALFEGIITDGVFMGIGNAFQVSVGTGLQIIVGTGRAWFEGTWTDNDTALPISLDAAEPLLKRIDSVILEINKSTRENSIYILKGTPASSPAAPAMTSNETIMQYRLANIYVGAGVTSLTAGNLTGFVGSTETPLCTGIMSTMSIEMITAAMEEDFDTWFANIQGQLSGDVAANLAAQIAAVDSALDALTASNRCRPITVGTAAPTGGTAGDIYLRYA